MLQPPGQINSENGEAFLFGEFELNPSRGMLLKNGVELALRRQCFQVLKYLILHQGVLVSKQELMGAVWSDVIVTESSLSQCILTIRRALNDDSKTLIRSIPRSGYLFDYPVTVKKTSPAEPVVIPPPQAVRRGYLSWVTATIFLFALTVLLYGRSTGHDASIDTRQPAYVAPPATSIAVLPFTDASSGRDLELIADGISEDVLNALARNPNLVVISRASAFSFKGTNSDIKSIAARLNVANVLEGSVRKEGDRFHVAARLVNANDNRSMWSKTYDLDAVDVYSLHNEIAKSVASVLGVEQAENMPILASQPEAIRLYVQGRYFLSRRAPGDLERATEKLRSAVEIDPGFTDAWVGLAGSLWLTAGEQPSRLTAFGEEARHALDTALELDPNHPEANARMAKYYSNIDQDNLAVRHFERAVEFGRNHPQVLAFAAGFEFAHFDYREAVEIQQRVVMLDPLSFTYQVNLALYLRHAGRLDESIAAYRSAFDLNPDAATEYRQDYLVVYLLKGQYDQAKSLALQLPKGSARDHHLAMVYLALDQSSRNGELLQRLSAETSADTALRLAEYYAFSGEIDLSFHWLDEAKKRQAGVVLHPASNTYFEVFLHSPFLQRLTHDVRWQAWREYLESQLQTPVISISAPQVVLTKNSQKEFLLDIEQE